jgi:uncharacterized protein YndB with AHSA1/START domain
MSERSAQHGTFVLERTFKAPRERVFTAFADVETKARWFSGPPEQWQMLRREMEFRVGGREHLSGKWGSGTVSAFDAQYHDIVPNERIVYAYDMHLDDRHISVSLTTIEFKSASGGTRLIFTEQDAFLDGHDDAGSRERGTGALLDRLESTLQEMLART